MAFSFTPPQQQQQTPLFQTPTQTQQQSLFQQNVSPFFQQQQQKQQQPLQTPFQQQQQQQQQQFLQQQQQLQQQSQLFLFTNDKAPATYSTKWADLHPDSQKLLLQIEERILEHRGESQRLDQCGRLYDSSVSNDSFELDASHILQELGGISTSMDRQKTLLQELMSTVKEMLRNTEIAVRSFTMLHPRFIHPNKNGSSNTVTTSQASGGAGTTNIQQTATAMVPVFDFYSGLPRKPSPFLQQTVTRFDKYLGECRQWIEELEQLLLLDSNRNSFNSSSSLLQSLPKVMLNVHDFFVHVAAKVESIHQYMESMKTAYLADQRRRGDSNDPFLEADRRETAKQAAAARRVHPTLHLPANSQPSTQVSGLFASSGTAGTSTAPPTSGSAPASSSGSGSPFFATPPAVASASSLFSTPITPAPLTGGSTPQQSIFGSFPTSTPTSNTAPLFGSTPTPTLNTAPLFGSTPATGASSFSTPFATGAATGSGASFGTLSKARAKSRTGRR